MAGTGTKRKGVSGLEIKIMLMRKGIKLNWVAARAGVTPSAVSRALDDNDEYLGRRIRPVIAESLGVTEEDLWPGSRLNKPG